MVSSKVLCRPVVAAVLAIGVTLLASVPAWAAKPAAKRTAKASTTGIDVSYPQCPGTSLPTGEAFAIVGVNGGVANDYNSCLNSEFSYAQDLTATTKQAPAQPYLNTGDPGNTVADWPSPSQLGTFGSPTTPDGVCDYASGTSGPGANSTACAYIYGYDMIGGITYSTGVIAGDLSAFSTATGKQLYSFPTWLDVETANSWQTGTYGLAMNVADLQGMVAAIDAADSSGTPTVGIYSTSYQWGVITGTPIGTAAGNLWLLPDWIPGARSAGGAASNCSLASFNGDSGITLTQWFGHPYDGDYSCIG